MEKTHNELLPLKKKGVRKWRIYCGFMAMYTRKLMVYHIKRGRP